MTTSTAPTIVMVPRTAFIAQPVTVDLFIAGAQGAV
jgi:hypothetical protein